MSNYEHGELAGIDFDEDENFDEIDLDDDEEDDLETSESLVVMAKDAVAGVAGTNPLLGNIVRQLDIDSII